MGRRPTDNEDREPVLELVVGMVWYGMADLILFYSFGANVNLCQFFFKTVKVIERSRDVTPRSKVKKYEGAPKVPPVPQICCNSYHYFRSYGILKKMARGNFFR